MLEKIKRVLSKLWNNIKNCFGKKKRIQRAVADTFDISVKEARALCEGFLIINGCIFYLAVNEKGDIDGRVSKSLWNGVMQDYRFTVANQLSIDENKAGEFKTAIKSMKDRTCQKEVVVRFPNITKKKYVCLDIFL